MTGFPLPYEAPGDLWPVVLMALRQQMTQATFYLWLMDSWVLTAVSTPTFWVIVVRNEYAWEWLTYRLHPVVVRTVAQVVGREVVVCFVPQTRQRPLSRL